ncbi:MAG: adenylate/guanylate cyclase protein [Hydrocarboniphaga sp.]|uniref:adenylate/guanylate cyclase domain-containing protein n=1 Tax=Hydrocarboniphaga sp. TaxID=2033016 RepID=UPI00261A34A8|nr:adenylate/guanylate cyclase domain-containing protein [Hydrocarboniphaga sp.]MDB5972856.1 adenylate/guanylate cyclase protein [Hydrocarboniphaga sp.]
MGNITPQVLVSLVALGMALAFLSADRKSSTSRALASALAATGLAIFLNQGLIPDARHAPSWSGWLALPESLAIVMMLEWLLRARRTVPVPADFDTRFGDRVLRFGQLSGVAYSVFALLWPQIRLDDFLRSADGRGAFGRAGFWLFATPVLLAVFAGMTSLVLLLNRRPDRSERLRLLAFAGCIPFMVSGFVLPPQLASVAIVIGEMILLIGSVHYHVMQGQRGLFMARFLSPEVARLVSERGLRQAMQDSQLTITAVACDLRGFSSFARAVPSQLVIQVLREYYDTAGKVVAQYGGTIKDYAGDGILVLVGAPIALPDHAGRAIELSLRLRSVCQELIEQWSELGPRLGIGVGVASGPVTVGVIGGIARLEYTAVGSAVNLACRLCEQAHDGEILIDDTTQLGAGSLTASSREPLILKGFGEPVAHFSI